METALGIRNQLDVDTRFLSLKYRQTRSYAAERDQVWYKDFYDDYKELDRNGLGDKIDGLQKISKQHGEAMPEGPEIGDPFKFDIPQKFLDFYKKLADWIVKKRQ